MTALPRFETLTRLGFAARGALYLLVAWLAVSAGRNASNADAMRSLADGGASRIVLGLIALGLLAYGAWRCLEAIEDLEGAGRGAKGAMVRAGHGLSGVAHLMLGVLAAALSLGLAGGGGGDGADKATGWVMDLPGGAWLVRLLAAGFVLGGLGEAWNAWRLKFLEQLEPQAARRPWVRWVGRLGYVARGVVFLIVGLLLWRAAGAHDPGAAGDTGEALGTLSGGLRLAVALGLGLFGVFSLVQARYRRITNPETVRRLGRSGARGAAATLDRARRAGR